MQINTRIIQLPICAAFVDSDNDNNDDVCLGVEGSPTIHGPVQGEGPPASLFC